MIGLSVTNLPDGVHVLWHRDPGVVDYVVEVWRNGTLTNRQKYQNSLRAAPFPNQTYDFGGLGLPGHYSVRVSTGSFPPLTPFKYPWFDYSLPRLDMESVEFAV